MPSRVHYATAEVGFLSTESPTGVAPVTVDIYDGRASAETYSWQTNGFELRQLPTAVTDWQDADQVERVHGEEIIEFAMQETGCDSVLFYPPILRTPETAKDSADYAPITTAHSDYTESYRTMIGDTNHPYQALLAPSMRRVNVAPESIRECRRVLTLQVWRNIGPALMQEPLCLADARSVPRSKLFALRVATYGGVETQFDSFGVLPPDDGAPYHWVTFPEMTHDEVLLFRAYDSDRAESNEPFWTPHCAFTDPRGAGTPRSSVEARAVCLFW